ncbi:ead/Ea22-like family protein [Citrobacter portucalensis]|uniref:ead/Ea22-like family protein n=1 Tax=Citrobacter portucalensis TaxID=1639133 RepID=UPI0039FC0505
MTALNKQALREAAQDASGAYERLSVMPADDIFDISLHESTRLDADITALNAFNEAGNPATVLALLDELEAAERQNGYLREQRDEWERKAISNFEECTEMSARIEELEAQRKLAFTASNRWADKFRESEKRMAELESCTVTVNLPNGDLDIAAFRIDPTEGPSWLTFRCEEDLRENGVIGELDSVVPLSVITSDVPKRGEVVVTVSGLTGSGKSAIAGEIEIAMRAIGVPVHWMNGGAEKRMTGAYWLTAIEMYKPTVRIVEVNVPRAAGIGVKGE